MISSSTMSVRVDSAPETTTYGTSSVGTAPLLAKPRRPVAHPDRTLVRMNFSHSTIPSTFVRCSSIKYAGILRTFNFTTEVVYGPRGGAHWWNPRNMVGAVVAAIIAMATMSLSALAGPDILSGRVRHYETT